MSDATTLGDAGVPSIPSSKILLCGAILVVMQPTDECIESENSFCNLEVADAIAVPGHICTDSGSYPQEVTCRAAWLFIDAEQEESGPEPEPEPEPDSEGWMDGPLYWVVVFVALIVIVGSLGVVNSNLRARSNRDSAVLVSEEE
ncbi:MAG: hypothetical protein CMA85_02600 [Euryarchaeota archaeon]|nr:hypothetical protein [Euryarchaeota archaeon]